MPTQIHKSQDNITQTITSHLQLKKKFNSSFNNQCTLHPLTSKDVKLVNESGKTFHPTRR